MPKVPLKGLHVVRSKGRLYYYAWRGGPRIEAPFGSPEFHAEFSEAKSPILGMDKRRFATWIALYRTSDDFKKIAESTKRTWRPWLDIIKDEFGELSTRQFDRPGIRVDINRWRKQWIETPRAADTAKQVLSRILSFVVAEGGLISNMCEGLPNLYHNNRADIIWEPADIQLICQHVSKEIGWAVRLAELTGLRQGDLLRLAWSHVGLLAIEMPTSKGRKRNAIAQIPITRDLRSLLESIPRRSTNVLTTSRGQPWSQFFSSTWDAAMKATGLASRDLHFHDLRGTAATHFYRAGMTEREIAQILGWSESRVGKIIDRYVNRAVILKDRIKRLEKRR